MAEVLVSFDVTFTDELNTFFPRAVGRQADDGMWEAWIEFVPSTPQTEALVTAIETRQPQRQHLVYWATGLSPVYLDGAFKRARNPTTVRVRVAEYPASSAPAPSVVRTTIPTVGPEAVLDPFEIGEQSLDILHQELNALNRPRLTNIIAAYDLNPGREDLRWMTDAQLVHFIVTAVDAQLLTGTRRLLR